MKKKCMARNLLNASRKMFYLIRNHIKDLSKIHLYWIRRTLLLWQSWSYSVISHASGYTVLLYASIKVPHMIIIPWKWFWRFIPLYWIKELFYSDSLDYLASLVMRLVIYTSMKVPHTIISELLSMKIALKIYIPLLKILLN